MRAPEPDAAGDAGDGSGTVEGLSLFRRVTGGERRLSPRCIADADDLASVVTQGSTDPKPRGARRKRASLGRAPGAAPGASWGPEVAAWARREAAGPQSGFASAVAAAAVARSQQRRTAGAPAAAPRGRGAPHAVAFENWPAPRPAYGAVRALPPPVAGGVSLALSRDSFAGLVVDTAREETASSTASGLRLSYVDGATLRGRARRAAEPAPAPRAAPVSAASTPAGSVAHTPSSSAPGSPAGGAGRALFLDLRSHAADLGALRDVGARAARIVAATGCVVVLASSTKPGHATVLHEFLGDRLRVAARVAVPLGGLASDSERRVLEILQWLAGSERLHSWAALDLDGLRSAYRSVARAAKAHPTFGGRFVAAHHRLDDAAERELVRQLLADERASADDAFALPPRPPARAAAVGGPRSILKRPAPPSPGRGRPAAATVAIVRDAAPDSSEADAPRKERPRPIVVPAPRPQAPSPALEGAENANSAPRSPTSARTGRKLLRCLDENTPTSARSPFSRPANKKYRADAAADAAAAPPDAPLLPQLSPFTKIAAI